MNIKKIVLSVGKNEDFEFVCWYWWKSNIMGR